MGADPAYRVFELGNDVLAVSPDGLPSSVRPSSAPTRPAEFTWVGLKSSGMVSFTPSASVDSSVMSSMMLRIPPCPASRGHHRVSRTHGRVSPLPISAGFKGTCSEHVAMQCGAGCRTTTCLPACLLSDAVAMRLQQDSSLGGHRLSSASQPRNSLLLRTRCELADCVEELELPALLDVVDRVCDLVRWGLYVELQAEPVDVPLPYRGKWQAVVSGRCGSWQQCCRHACADERNAGGVGWGRGREQAWH